MSVRFLLRRYEVTLGAVGVLLWGCCVMRLLWTGLFRDDVRYSEDQKFQQKIAYGGCGRRKRVLMPDQDPTSLACRAFWALFSALPALFAHFMRLF